MTSTQGPSASSSPHPPHHPQQQPHSSSLNSQTSPHHNNNNSASASVPRIITTTTPSQHIISISPQQHFFYFDNGYYTNSISLGSLLIEALLLGHSGTAAAGTDTTGRMRSSHHHAHHHNSNSSSSSSASSSHHNDSNRIQIYTRIRNHGKDLADVNNHDGVASLRNNNNTGGLQSGDSNNYTKIYDDIFQGQSIIYLNKVHYIDMIWIKGSMDTVAAMETMTTSSTAPATTTHYHNNNYYHHHATSTLGYPEFGSYPRMHMEPSLQIYLGRECDVSGLLRKGLVHLSSRNVIHHQHQYHEEDAFQSQESSNAAAAKDESHPSNAYINDNQDRLQNILNNFIPQQQQKQQERGTTAQGTASLTPSTTSHSTSTTTTTHRSYESALTAVNSINYQIQRIQFTKLCRNWLHRDISPQQLYGTREELKIAQKRLKTVMHQQLDKWLQDSDDSLDDGLSDDDKDATIVEEWSSIEGLQPIHPSENRRRQRSPLVLSRSRLKSEQSAQNSSLPRFPVARSGHQMFSYKDSLYMYGGYTDKWDLADFWRFDTKQQKWHCITMNAAEQGGPSERSCHQCTVHANKVYFLGRYLNPRLRSPDATKSDFYSFDLKTHEWELLSGDTFRDGGPNLIYDHQMCTVNDYIYVFGGRIIHPIGGPNSFKNSPQKQTQDSSLLMSPTNKKRSHVPEDIYSGLYCYNIYSRKWKHIHRVHDLSKPVFISTHPVPEHMVDEYTQQIISDSEKEEKQHQGGGVILNHIPLHAHVGHSMVYNSKTHQLLIISSGCPKQQNTTSFLQASRRQILAYDLNSDLVFDITSTSKLAHRLSLFKKDPNESDADAFRELRRFEKDLNQSFYGWPPFFHKFYSDDPADSHHHVYNRNLDSFSHSANNLTPEYNSRREDARFLDKVMQSATSMENHRVEATQHLSVLDEEHQELHIYETIIADASTSPNGYAYSTLWSYSLETDTWILVKRFNQETLDSADGKDRQLENGPMPHPRFSSQFVFNQQNGQFYLFGGNPGKLSHPRTKLGDLHTWKMDLPSEKDLRAAILFFLHRQLFLEMDPSKLETVEFMRDHLTPLIRNMSDRRYAHILSAHLHQLSMYLMKAEASVREMEMMNKNLIQLIRELVFVQQ